MSDKKEKKVVYKAKVLPRFDGKDVPIRTKNAYGFGVKGKDLYFAIMYKVEDEKGREVYKKRLHTIKDDNNKEIKEVAEEDVEKLFNSLRFY